MKHHIKIVLYKRQPSRIEKFFDTVVWFGGLGGALWVNHNHLGSSWLVELFILGMALLLLIALNMKDGRVYDETFKSYRAAIEWLNEQAQARQ